MARIARNPVLGWLVTAVALAIPVAAAAVTLHVGDLVVTDYGTSCGGAPEAADGIYQVDPATGIRTPISAGGLFSCPSGVTILPDWTILVADRGDGPGSVIRVDPTTGSQRVFARPSLGSGPVETIIDPVSNDILVVVEYSLLRAQRSTGALSFLPVGGSFLYAPSAVADSNVPGRIIVTNQNLPAQNLDLVRIDPSSATAVPATTAGVDYPYALTGVARAGDGFLYVLSSGGRVLRFDEGTATSTVVTSGGNLHHFNQTGRIAFDPGAGDLVVADRFCCGRAPTPDPSGPGPFVRVDPATGTQTVLTSAGFLNPIGIAVVPARTCGNGTLDPGEQCDDGNAIDGDTCETDCSNPVCGNGITDPGEACDDGNAVEGDGCDTNCTVPRCGNGITDPGEECDDANTDDGDECHNDCRALVCSRFSPASGPRLKLTITNLGGVPNDGNIRFRGSATLPGAPSPFPGGTGYPPTSGLRIAIVDDANTILSDVTIPPGAYDPVTKTGWKGTGAGINTVFRYKQGGVPTPGVQKASVKIQYSHVDVSFSGKGGEYAVTAASLPLHPYVVLDTPVAPSGLCFRAGFPANGTVPGCRLNGIGTTVICK